MKNKVLKILLIGILGILPVKVSAASASVNMECPSTAAAGATVNCTITATIPNGVTANGASGKYILGSGVTFNNYIYPSGASVYTNGNTIKVGFAFGKEFTGTTSLGTLQVVIPSYASANQTYTVGIGNISISDVNYENYDAPSVSKTIRVVSNENSLSSLSISGGSISFNPDNTSYSTTVNSASTTISATAKDSRSTISGDVGTKSLNYGVNTFRITVTSETGSKRTYTISITRPDNRSTNNYLSSLEVSGFSLKFNKNTTSYDLQGNNSSTVIKASKEDSKATISGDIGTKSLNYGTNTFKIVVTAENGSQRTYTIYITRPNANKNANNFLSSLTASGINFSFNKNNGTYNLQTSNDLTVIEAIKEHSSAQISGDIGRKNLNFGLNTFKIKVTAENSLTRTYTLNITRVDSRSDDNYLKMISISSGELKFNKTTYVYNVDVENNIESVTLLATLNSNTASFVSGFEPKEVKLKNGNNTVYIKVRSEKGTERTYTININRKDGRDSDASLKDIKLSSGKIDFKSDVLDYSLNVEYKINKLNIVATPNSSKAKVSIEQDDELKVGENIIRIIVIAENEKQTIYTIKVNRKEEGYTLSDDNYIKSLSIKNVKIDFKKNVYTYKVKTNLKRLSFNIELSDKNAKYEILNNNSLKKGSKVQIKVTAENGDEKYYTFNIEAEYNLILIIAVIVIVVLAIAGIMFYIIKMKKNNKTDEVLDINDFNEVK